MITKPTIKQKRGKRVARIRAVVKGTESRPRVAFQRSHYRLYAQLVDDGAGKTLATVSVMKTNMTSAIELAKLTVVAVKKLGASAVVFDRGGNKYHGVVKAFADGIREGGVTV
jgi:large subunit ribosomal protein L18